MSAFKTSDRWSKDDENKKPTEAELRERREKIEREREQRVLRDAKDKAEATCKTIETKLKEVETKLSDAVKAKEAAEKARDEAVKELDERESEPSHTGMAQRALELLGDGRFCRRMTWGERRALRRIESVSDRMRKELLHMFPDACRIPVISMALDTIAQIEVSARLQLMRGPDPVVEDDLEPAAVEATVVPAVKAATAPTKPSKPANDDGKKKMGSALN